MGVDSQIIDNDDTTYLAPGTTYTTTTTSHDEPCQSTAGPTTDPVPVDSTSSPMNSRTHICSAHLVDSVPASQNSPLHSFSNSPVDYPLPPQCSSFTCSPCISSAHCTSITASQSTDPVLPFNANHTLSPIEDPSFNTSHTQNSTTPNNTPECSPVNIPRVDTTAPATAPINTSVDPPLHYIEYIESNLISVVTDSPSQPSLATSPSVTPTSNSSSCSHQSPPHPPPLSTILDDTKISPLSQCNVSNLDCDTGTGSIPVVEDQDVPNLPLALEPSLDFINQSKPTNQSIHDNQTIPPTQSSPLNASPTLQPVIPTTTTATCDSIPVSLVKKNCESSPPPITSSIDTLECHHPSLSETELVTPLPQTTTTSPNIHPLAGCECGSPTGDTPTCLTDADKPSEQVACIPGKSLDLTFTHAPNSSIIISPITPASILQDSTLPHTTSNKTPVVSTSESQQPHSIELDNLCTSQDPVNCESSNNQPGNIDKQLASDITSQTIDDASTASEVVSSDYCVSSVDNSLSNLESLNPLTTADCPPYPSSTTPQVDFDPLDDISDCRSCHSLSSISLSSEDTDPSNQLCTINESAYPQSLPLDLCNEIDSAKQPLTSSPPTPPSTPLPSNLQPTSPSVKSPQPLSPTPPPPQHYPSALIPPTPPLTTTYPASTSDLSPQTALRYPDQPSTALLRLVCDQLPMLDEDLIAPSPTSSNGSCGALGYRYSLEHDKETTRGSSGHNNESTLPLPIGKDSSHLDDTYIELTKPRRSFSTDTCSIISTSSSISSSSPSTDSTTDGRDPLPPLPATPPSHHSFSHHSSTRDSPYSLRDTASCSSSSPLTSDLELSPDYHSSSRPSASPSDSTDSHQLSTRSCDHLSTPSPSPPTRSPHPALRSYSSTTSTSSRAYSLDLSPSPRTTSSPSTHLYCNTSSSPDLQPMLTSCDPQSTSSSSTSVSSSPSTSPSPSPVVQTSSSSTSSSPASKQLPSPTSSSSPSSSSSSDLCPRLQPVIPIDPVASDSTLSTSDCYSPPLATSLHRRSTSLCQSISTTSSSSSSLNSCTSASPTSAKSTTSSTSSNRSVSPSSRSRSTATSSSSNTSSSSDDTSPPSTSCSSSSSPTPPLPPTPTTPVHPTTTTNAVGHHPTMPFATSYSASSTSTYRRPLKPLPTDPSVSGRLVHPQCQQQTLFPPTPPALTSSTPTTATTTLVNTTPQSKQLKPPVKPLAPISPQVQQVPPNRYKAAKVFINFL